MEFNKKKLITLGLGATLVLTSVVGVAKPAQAAVQKPAEQVFQSQHNTGKNSMGNCDPATTKMILNVFGLGSNLSVADISEKYHGVGYSGEVLEKYGVSEVNIDTRYDSNAQARQYLDKGYPIVVSIATADGSPHVGLVVDYRMDGSKTQYRLLDPNDISCTEKWVNNSIDYGSGVGYVNVLNVCIYEKLEKFDLQQKASDGHTFKTTLFYDKVADKFYYSMKSNEEYAGFKNEDCKKGDQAKEWYKNDNWFNVRDTIYKKDTHFGFVMINGEAHYELPKEVVKQTWGITR